MIMCEFVFIRRWLWRFGAYNGDVLGSPDPTTYIVS